jgi:uncharacterized protein involved in exopolysaccharide biosynthesis
MEKPRKVEYADDENDLAIYFAVLRKVFWKVVVFSFAMGVVTLVVTFFIPNTYQASAVITPTVEEGKKSPAFNALAFLGINIGGPSTVEELDTLFNSNDLTARVFKRHDFWAIALGKRYDPSTGKMKLSWIDRLFGNAEDLKQLGDWDAIRLGKKSLKVSINKRAGTVSLSFESPSAEGSAEIVKYYLEEGKGWLQEETLERARKNKRFIEEQIAKTHDALTRDRLYSMYGQEVEKEMMARNREQFGFRVIDSPRVPDRKYTPRRGLSTILATILSFVAGCVFFTVRGTKYS